MPYIHITTANGTAIAIKVEKKRRKTLVLRVSRESGQVLLSAPLNTPDDYILSFVQKRAGWLEKQLNAILPHKKEYFFKDGEVFYYQGRPLTLCSRPGTRSRAEAAGGELIIWQKTQLPPAARQKALDDFFRREAQSLCQKALLRMLEHFRVLLKINFIPALKVRRMSSRWGSCRPLARAVSLSSRLVHLPPECLDYVVAHELCHFYRADHSAAFWQILAFGMPDWRERKKLLDDTALYMIY